jgi:hypothetical protein
VAAVGRKSVSYAFEFSHAGHPVARGRVTAVCCRVRRPHGIESIDIPAGLRARLLGERPPGL